MPKASPLKALLLIFAVCSSGCAAITKEDQKVIEEGPAIIICVLDVINQGYQCSRFDETPYFRSFDAPESSEMICISPSNIEIILKACKKGSQVGFSSCTFKGRVPYCQDSYGNSISLSLDQLDNYVCMSPQDRDRLLARCNPRGY